MKKSPGFRGVVASSGDLIEQQRFSSIYESTFSAMVNRVFGDARPASCRVNSASEAQL
jgi:hypothetical protein